MDILTTREDGVATIEFNRPQKKNAITAEMYAALADALTAAREEPAIRAVMIVGATKRLMKHGRIAAIESRMLLEGEEFRERLQSPEAREAFTAFYERRRPDFSRFD
jgi:enoyl-CoA hydratase/carnithine racemase